MKRGDKQLLWDTWLSCSANLTASSGCSIVNNILIPMFKLSRRDKDISSWQSVYSQPGVCTELVILVHSCTVCRV